MKICCRCKQELPLSMFSKGGVSRKDGLNPQCKLCDKMWRDANKEYLLEYKRAYHNNPETKERRKKYKKDYYEQRKETIQRDCKEYYTLNRDRYLLNKSKDRAKEDGLEHSITLDDIVIPEYCPYLGIKLTTDLGKGQLETNASLDRIDSTKGYVPGNVQVISRKANTMKNNATAEELLIFAENVIRINMGICETTVTKYKETICAMLNM